MPIHCRVIEPTELVVVEGQQYVWNINVDPPCDCDCHSDKAACTSCQVRNGVLVPIREALKQGWKQTK